MRTNLIPSNSLTHADGGMSSNGTESISLFDQPLCLLILQLTTRAPEAAQPSYPRLNGSALIGESQYTEWSAETHSGIQNIKLSTVTTNVKMSKLTM